MRREGGTITLWVLGLCVSLMFLAGLSLDLWRAVAVRRELSAMADASAAAGANGVNEAELRSGKLRLDDRRARALAGAELARAPRAARLDWARIDVTGERVTVTLRDHVDMSLLGIFLGGRSFDIEAHASAAPDERR